MREVDLKEVQQLVGPMVLFKFKPTMTIIWVSFWPWSLFLSLFFSRTIQSEVEQKRKRMNLNTCQAWNKRSLILVWKHNRTWIRRIVLPMLDSKESSLVEAGRKNESPSPSPSHLTARVALMIRMMHQAVTARMTMMMTMMIQPPKKMQAVEVSAPGTARPSLQRMHRRSPVWNWFLLVESWIGTGQDLKLFSWWFASTKNMWKWAFPVCGLVLGVRNQEENCYSETPSLTNK